MHANHPYPGTFRRRPHSVIGAAAAIFLLTVVPASGETPADDAAIAEIRVEISRLRADYDRRLSALEARLAALEGTPGAGGVAAADDPTDEGSDELARLRAAAREAVGGAPASDAPSTTLPTAPSVGAERNLNRLNPEISFTGIVVGASDSDGREEWSAQEFELDLQAALDPFSRTRWTIAFGDEGVEIEEGYLEFTALPGGLELLAGKFRQRFGPLNRQHLHALPQTEYPLVYQAFFGEEGLAQTGLSATWLLPRPWASANELTLELTDGENEAAFQGEAFESFAVLARLKNFWELSDATWIEWGLSGVGGRTPDGGDSRVYGTDLTVSWQPPSRAKYRALTWRTELLRSEREVGGVELEALGLYSYLESLLARNLWAGVRFDSFEDPFDPRREVRGIAPYLTWWQSEYVRLRAEYGYQRDELTDRSSRRFTLQLTWAAGPHKHTTY